MPAMVKAPGRVNLIGEHTDYNDGFVLPAAIQFQTSVAFAPRKDNKLVCRSENYDQQVEFDLEQLPTNPRTHWSDYVVGVARMLSERATLLVGANLLICSDVPQGAGLSSSASLEVGVCQALQEINSMKAEGARVARLCQRAENEFVGARCGIMDQFVVVHGKKDCAMLLDCRTLEYRHVLLPEHVRLVICNTMIGHRVAGGEYNQRRRECEAGAQFFGRKSAGVRALRDVSMEDFLRHEGELPEKVRKRCLHVITENARVGQSAEALACHDLHRLGRLMRESHASLRDDFQVSCKELDLLVDLGGQAEGVYGARMTGGGFGGCTVNLVKRERADEFQSQVAEGYERATGKRPQIYVCTAGDGVRRVF
jgi:galactokinase